MNISRLEISLPSAAEMATCFREPSKKPVLRERIQRYYSELRMKVAKPDRKEERLLKAYGKLMSRFRAEEETVLEILDAFARGDALSVREAAARLTRL
jgi:hypothetical protein